MRKNLLALSIAAMVGGLSGVANAAVFDVTAPAGAGTTNVLAAPGLGVAATVLEPTVSGIGHILLVPYFTTQGANASLLNIVNTDQVNGKAVKLRYRGASNSDDIFDITIYLSPGDMWTANVSANGDISALSTTDTSCTIPSAAAIKAQGGKFSTARVLGNAAAETREGYIEILNMADVPPGTGVPTGNSALYNAVLHSNGVAPCTTAVMQAQGADLSHTVAANEPATRGYSWPTGGLFANWTIVNVADKASVSGEAVAIRAAVVANGASGAANIAWFPQNSNAVTYPTGHAAAAGAGTNASATLTTDPLLALTAAFASSVANTDFPDLSTPYIATPTVANAQAQALNLANAIETRFVANEFLTAGPAQFATDWVLSMPTRRYALAMNYGATGAARFLINANVNRHFTTANSTLNAAGTRICVTPGGDPVAYDAEEGTSANFVISPAAVLRFCGETSVVTFNSATSAVLGAQLAQQSVTPRDFNGNTILGGWAQLPTPGATAGRGLPIIGFAAAKAQGANLGGTWVHRTSR